MGATPENPAAETPMAGNRKIFGMSRAAFFACLAVIIAGAVWKSGIISQLISRAPIDVNSASIEQLKDLPGVDKKIAEDIVAKRPFKDVDDLKRVKGIGNTKIETLRPLVTVGP